MPISTHLRLAFATAALALICNSASAQDTTFRSNAVSIHLGGPAIQDLREVSGGGGAVIGVGWRHTFGLKDKLRIHPKLTIGAFDSRGTTDVPDVYFNTFVVSVDLHYDALRYRAFSLVLGAGPYAAASAGLEGTGGWPPGRRESSYFATGSAGVSAALGFRFDPPNHGVVYELRPVNVCAVSGDFILFYPAVGVEFKVRA